MKIKIINEELNRIQELMNVSLRGLLEETNNRKSKRLIMEGTPTGRLGEYAENLIDHIGVRAEGPVGEKYLSKLKDKMEQFNMSLETKLPDEVMKKVESLTERKVKDSRGRTIDVLTPEKRLAEFKATLNRYKNELDVSLMTARGEAKLVADKLFLETSSTPRGEQITAEYENYASNFPNDSTSVIIDIMKNDPLYKDVPEWWWKKLEEMTERDSRGKITFNNTYYDTSVSMRQNAAEKVAESTDDLVKSERYQDGIRESKEPGFRGWAEQRKSELKSKNSKDYTVEDNIDIAVLMETGYMTEKEVSELYLTSAGLNELLSLGKDYAVYKKQTGVNWYGRRKKGTKSFCEWLEQNKQRKCPTFLMNMAYEPLEFLFKKIDAGTMAFRGESSYGYGPSAFFTQILLPVGLLSGLYITGVKFFWGNAKAISEFTEKELIANPQTRIEGDLKTYFSYDAPTLNIDGTDYNIYDADNAQYNTRFKGTPPSITVGDKNSNSAIIVFAQGDGIKVKIGDQVKEILSARIEQPTVLGGELTNPVKLFAKSSGTIELQGGSAQTTSKYKDDLEGFKKWYNEIKNKKADLSGAVKDGDIYKVSLNAGKGYKYQDPNTVTDDKERFKKQQ